MSLIKSLFSKDSETALVELEKGFVGIAKLEELLSKQRYVVGNSVTEADIRLFKTLIRFDVSQKKTNEQNLTQFPNVVGYLRDLYQIPAMKRTVNWDHLKIAIVNHRPDEPVAEGPFIDYDAPHGRD